jgi:hypothetical protein
VLLIKPERAIPAKSAGFNIALIALIILMRIATTISYDARCSGVCPVCM